MAKFGKLTFRGVDIPFDAKNPRNKNSYLIDESYFDKLVELSKFFDNLSETTYESNGFTTNIVYQNCIIDKIHRTTNFPGKMEVTFGINIPIQRIRDIKLNLLICD
jgi:hypothetical protein